MFHKISAIALITAMLVTPAGALSLNLGGGSGGILNLGGGGGSSNTNTSVTVNAGNLLGGDGEDTEVTLDLFGDGGSTIADLNLDAAGEHVNGTITIGGDDNDLLIDLFGLGDTTGDNTSVAIGVGGLGLGGTGLDGLGTDGLLEDLFGSGNGGNGGGGGNGGTGGTGGTGGGGTGVQVASIGDVDAAGCFMPDAAQISTLLNRHNYASSTAAWSGVSNVQVVEIALCNDAKLRVASAAQANGNYLALQRFIANQAAIRAGLRTSGHSIDDVVAVDQSGGKLIVYVI